MGITSGFGSDFVCICLLYDNGTDKGSSDLVAGMNWESPDIISPTVEIEEVVGFWDWACLFNSILR